MKDNSNSKGTEVTPDTPAVNGTRIQQYATNVPGVGFLVNKFFIHCPTRTEFGDHHPIDETVTHAIAVYQSVVDEGLLRLAGKLTERNMSFFLDAACGIPDVSYISSTALLTRIANTTDAETYEELPKVHQDLFEILNELDFIERVALVDLARQYWRRSCVLSEFNSIREAMLKLGLELRD